MAKNNLFGDLVIPDIAEEIDTTKNDGADEDKGKDASDVTADVEGGDDDVIDGEEDHGTDGEDSTQSDEAEPDSTEEEDITPATVLYEYITSRGIMDSNDEFDGTQEKLDEYLEELPTEAFMSAVSSLPELSQQLVQYAFNLGEKATPEELSKFFGLLAQPEEVEYNIEEEEGARKFLKDYYLSNKIYKDEELADTQLDILSDKEKLIEYAKDVKTTKDEEHRLAVEAERKRAEEARKVEEQRNKEFISGIKNELKELGWSDQRQATVIKNFDSSVIARKNEEIRKSPKAMIQLADVYSYFDEKTGEFDFSAFEAKGKSTQTKKKKGKLERDKFHSMASKLKPKLGKKSSSDEEKTLHDDLVFK